MPNPARGNDSTDVSIVVPAYRADHTLEACVQRLLEQRFDGRFEVIVFSSADAERDLPRLRPHPRLRVIESPFRVPAYAARNQAVAQANGTLVAFTDADALPDPDWLTELVAAGDGRHAVAGSICNGTPESNLGTAEYLVEFLDFHPHRPGWRTWHGSTANLLIPRETWDRFGPLAGYAGWSEDTGLTLALSRAGLLVSAPRARVTHVNRTDLRRVTRHQFELGRSSAALARAAHHPWHVLLRWSPLAPLATLGRVASLYARLAARVPRELGRGVRLAPVVLLVLGAWGSGLAVEGARLDLRRVRGRRVRRLTTPPAESA